LNKQVDAVLKVKKKKAFFEGNQERKADLTSKYQKQDVVTCAWQRPRMF
jgi:hypothetical protein